MFFIKYAMNFIKRTKNKLKTNLKVVQVGLKTVVTACTLPNKKTVSTEINFSVTVNC